MSAVGLIAVLNTTAANANVTDSGPDPDALAGQVLLAIGDVLTFVGGLGALVGNALLLVLFCRNRRLVKKPGIDAIAPLSVSDMFTGLGCFVAAMHRRLCTSGVTPMPPKMFMLLLSGEIQSGSSTSLLLAVAIAFDRLWAIIWPFRFLRSNHKRVVFAWTLGIVCVTLGLQIAAFVQTLLYYGSGILEPTEFYTSIGLWLPWYLEVYSGIMVLASIVLTALFICVVVAIIYTERKMNSYYASTNSQRFRVMEQQHITRLSATAIFVCVIFVTIPYLSWEFLTTTDYIYSSNTMLTAYGSLLSSAMALNATFNMAVYALRYEPIRSGLADMLMCRKRRVAPLRQTTAITASSALRRTSNAAAAERDAADVKPKMIRQSTLP